jgi:hypothetical protein
MPKVVDESMTGNKADITSHCSEASNSHQPEESDPMDLFGNAKWDLETPYTQQYLETVFMQNPEELLDNCINNNIALSDDLDNELNTGDLSGCLADTNIIEEFYPTTPIPQEPSLDQVLA